MSNILLGLVGLYFLFGGGTRLLGEFRLKNLEAAAILLAIIALNLGGEIAISESFALKLGGAAFYFAAFFMLKDRRWYIWVYNLFAAAAVGAFIFVVGGCFAVLTINYYTKLAIFGLLQVLAVSVVSDNSKAAFGIATLSMLTVDTLNYFAFYDNFFALGFGGLYERTVFFAVITTLIFYLVKKTVLKLFPNADFMLRA